MVCDIGCGECVRGWTIYEGERELRRREVEAAGVVFICGGACMGVGWPFCFSWVAVGSSSLLPPSLAHIHGAPVKGSILYRHSLLVTVRWVTVVCY